MGGRFGQGFVVHLNGLNLSGQLVRSEGDNHTGFDDTSFDNGGISRFDRFGIGFGVSSVAIQNWRVSVADLSGVVENDNLGGKVLSTDSGLVLGVRGDISTLDILD